MTLKLTFNPLTQAATQLGQLLADSLLALGKRQSGFNADNRGAALPSDSGIAETDIYNGIRDQGAGRAQAPDMGWGVILWDEDGHDRDGAPGSRNSAVQIRTVVGTQP